MRKLFMAALFTTAFPFAAEAAQSGGYGLTIPQGFESGGRVSLNDAPSYRICLRSDRAERSDVELIVNGSFYGAYSLSAYGSTCLDRLVPDAAVWSYGHRQTRPGARDEIVARFVPLSNWTSYAYVHNGYGGFGYVPRPSAAYRDYARAVTLTLQAEMRPGPWLPAYQQSRPVPYWGY